MCEDIRLGAATMLDFHFNIKGRDAGEDNWNALLALIFNLAEAVGPTWIGKARCRASVDFLLYYDWAELLLLLYIVLVFKLDELVLIFSGMTCV